MRNFRKEIRGSPHINQKRRKPKKNYSERDVKDQPESRSFHDDLESDLDSYYDDSGVSLDAKHDGRSNWRRRRGSRSSRAVHRIAHGLWNVTIEDLEGGELPSHLADWLNFGKAIGQCDAIHENLRREYGMDDDGSSSVERSRLVLIFLFYLKSILLIFPFDLKIIIVFLMLVSKNFFN